MHSILVRDSFSHRRDVLRAIKKKLYCLSIQREKTAGLYTKMRPYHTRNPMPGITLEARPPRRDEGWWRPHGPEPSALVHQFRKPRKPPGQTPSQHDVVESKRERTKKLNCLSIQEKKNTRLIYREKTILGEAEYHNGSPKPSTSAGARPPPQHGGRRGPWGPQAPGLMPAALGRWVL